MFNIVRSDLINKLMSTIAKLTKHIETMYEINIIAMSICVMSGKLLNLKYIAPMVGNVGKSTNIGIANEISNGIEKNNIQFQFFLYDANA